MRLFRPFSLEHFAKALPKSVKAIAVLDRTSAAGPSASPSTRTCADHRGYRRRTIFQRGLGSYSYLEVRPVAVPESGPELYSDLSLAYSAEATYAIVFSYPNLTTYGTLTQSDFEALQKFWTAIHTNPGSFPSSPAEVAYVVPADFGFGFRNANDTIWGLFPADNYTSTQKIWNDTQVLLARYDNKLNIIYDDPSIIEPTLNNYVKVFYWNQTVS